MRVIAHDGSVDIAYENAVFYTKYIKGVWCVCAKFVGNVDEFVMGRYNHASSLFNGKEYCMQLINNLHHYYITDDKVFVFPDRIVELPKFSEY